MFGNVRGLVLTFAALAVIGTAFADAPPAAPHQPPFKIHTLTRDITVAADGSSVTVTHTEIQIVTDALLTQMAQQQIGYDATLQDIAVDDAYTLKADGRKLAVAPDAILTRGSPLGGTALLYQDLRQKIIVFPSVEVGDSLVYTLTTHSKPMIPGQFVYDTVVPRTLTIDQTRVTVTAPAALPLYADSKGLDVVRNANSLTVSYANPVAGSDILDPVSRFDRGPRFSVSTFESYDDLNAAYAPLVLPRLAVTPKIQAQADAITAGVSDPREKAHRIYDWVSHHIRYVAIEFGSGAIVPHEADTVLANAYGDCKDHAALFLALLKAERIDGNLVLVNLQNGYSIPTVPTFGAFDHMIAWLPRFGLYADTTAGNAAFGTLPSPEYGKPVIVIGGRGAVVRHIPVRGEDDATVHLQTAATIDYESRLKLDTTTTGTGALATTLRGLAVGFANGGSQKLAGELLKARDMPRATGDFSAAPPPELTDNFIVKGSFATLRRPQLLSGADFPVPEDFSPILPTGSVFFGPVAEMLVNDADGVPCYGGREVEDLSVSFPANRHLARLPADASIRTANLTFTSHWAVSGNALTVHRELRAHFDTPVCTADTHKDVLVAFARIRADYQAKIALVAAP